MPRVTRRVGRHGYRDPVYDRAVVDLTLRATVEQIENSPLGIRAAFLDWIIHTRVLEVITGDFAALGSLVVQDPRSNRGPPLLGPVVTGLLSTTVRPASRPAACALLIRIWRRRRTMRGWRR
jgi:hypothetical protein